MRSVEIIPSASALVQSLRGFGYSPETALADLIDNSIAARADTIAIELDWRDGSPQVAVLDNGQGMDEEGLVSAMCFGGAGPTALREETDLGRFGLGLKTASLSQCRQMTVITRREGETAALSWDIDEVIKRGRWEAIVPEKLPAGELSQKLLESQKGSLVVWERMDAIGGLSGLSKEAFFHRVSDIHAHFAMVFHRFLGGDAKRISISINGRAVRAWDPFQRTHPATTTMQTEPIRHAGSVLSITPYVMPHRDRFANDAEYEAAGGPGGWSERQGFYVYRSKRLIVSGGWLGLGGARAWTREESSRLARLAVDLPTALDADWRIDVRKSQARPPGLLRPRLTAIASLCRDRAREVFAWRGNRARGQVQQSSVDWVWLPQRHGAVSQYRINREHPAISPVLNKLGADAKLIDALLTVVERTVPVERIWLDVAEEEGAPAHSLSSEEVENLARQLEAIATTLPADLSPIEMADRLVRYLPGDTSVLRQELLKLLEAAK